MAHSQRRIDSFHYENRLIKKGDTLHINEGSRGGQYVYIHTVWGGTPPITLPFEGQGTWIIIDHFRRKKVKGKRITYAIGFLPNLRNASVYIDIKGAVESGEVMLR